MPSSNISFEAQQQLFEAPPLEELVLTGTPRSAQDGHILANIVTYPFENAAIAASCVEIEENERHSMPELQWLTRVSKRTGQLAVWATSEPTQSEEYTEEPRDPLETDRTSLLSRDVKPEEELMKLIAYGKEWLRAKYGPTEHEVAKSSLIMDELAYAEEAFRETEPSNEYDKVKKYGRFINKIWELIETPDKVDIILNDPQTNLRSRRALEKFKKEHADNEGNIKDGSKYLMIDLNNFGVTNKVEGQEHGDNMLVITAGALMGAGDRTGIRRKRMFRGTQGDEFVVVVPDDETAEKFLKQAQAILKEVVSIKKEDDPRLHGALKNRGGIYNYKGEIEIISISGATGNTLAEADAKVQSVKKEDKARRAAEYAETGEYPQS